jgi:DNA invertase Pin-like site-specific DNA recombinase
MKAAIYMRVSKDDGSQTTDNQELQLKEFCQRQQWNLITIFADEKTGKNTDRPGLKAMLAAASRKEFDILVFWSLDRISRGGALETLKLLEQLKTYGVGYRSLQEAYLDSQHPFSDMLVAFIATLAKMEREKIVERTKAGLERTRRAGTVLGRPKLTEHAAKIMQFIQQGLRPEEIKIEYTNGKGVKKILSESTIRRILKAA